MQVHWREVSWDEAIKDFQELFSFLLPLRCITMNKYKHNRDSSPCFDHVRPPNYFVRWWSSSATSRLPVTSSTLFPRLVQPRQEYLPSAVFFMPLALPQLDQLAVRGTMRAPWASKPGLCYRWRSTAVSWRLRSVVRAILMKARQKSISVPWSLVSASSGPFFFSLVSQPFIIPVLQEQHALRLRPTWP